MAKEFPYFRFTPQEWQNGDISLESYEMRGFFIEVCCYYWINNCSTTKAKLAKKFSNDIALLEELFSLEIIKENDENLLEIFFLDEQYNLLSEKNKKRSEAGRKGGLKRASNAKAMLKQNPSYKDKDKYKDKYNKFIAFLTQ